MERIMKLNVLLSILITVISCGNQTLPEKQENEKKPAEINIILKNQSDIELFKTTDMMVFEQKARFLATVLKPGVEYLYDYNKDVMKELVKGVWTKPGEIEDTFHPSGLLVRNTKSWDDWKYGKWFFNEKDQWVVEISSQVYTRTLYSIKLFSNGFCNRVSFRIMTTDKGSLEICCLVFDSKYNLQSPMSCIEIDTDLHK